MPLTEQEKAIAAGIAAAEYHKNEMAKWKATIGYVNSNGNPNIKNSDYTTNNENTRNTCNPYYKTLITQVQGPYNNINALPLGAYTNAHVSGSDYRPKNN